MSRIRAADRSVLSPGSAAPSPTLPSPRRALGDPTVLARVLPYAYLVLGDPDDLDERGPIADELVELGRDLGQPTTEWEGLQLRFSVDLQRGDPSLDDVLARMTEIAAIVHEPARDTHVETASRLVDRVRAPVMAAHLANPHP